MLTSGGPPQQGKLGDYHQAPRRTLPKAWKTRLSRVSDGQCKKGYREGPGTKPGSAGCRCDVCTNAAVLVLRWLSSISVRGLAREAQGLRLVLYATGWAAARVNEC